MGPTTRIFSKIKRRIAFQVQLTCGSCPTPSDSDGSTSWALRQIGIVELVENEQRKFTVAIINNGDCDAEWPWVLGIE